MAEVVGPGVGAGGATSFLSCVRGRERGWVRGECPAHIFQRVVPLIGHIEKVKMCLVFLSKI